MINFFIVEKKGTAIVAFRGGASLIDTDVVLTGSTFQLYMGSFPFI